MPEEADSLPADLWFPEPFFPEEAPSSGRSPVSEEDVLLEEPFAPWDFVPEESLEIRFTISSRLLMDSDGLPPKLLFPSSLEKRAKRLSSSSGLSTLVMISTRVSPDSGIASIINGELSTVNPYSRNASCIMSWKRSLAFSEPYASSWRLILREARSSLVSVQRIWLSLIFSIFKFDHFLISDWFDYNQYLAFCKEKT